MEMIEDEAIKSDHQMQRMAVSFGRSRRSE